MQKVDVNGDGSIDFKEFMNMEVFKSFDADGDGEITAAEFKRGVEKLNPTMAAKEIEALFT
jgi:Ca2+-binding EF-hand superfamily protein